jgi:transposase-like protein
MHRNVAHRYGFDEATRSHRKAKTLVEATRYYSDEQVCIDTAAALRWPNGKPVCPKCGVEEGDRKHYWLKTQKRWKCYACRKQFSVKVNSVFEDSALGLDIWLIALWMLVNCKNGVSSHEIARETGIAQKNAWHLLHRLRYALQPKDGGKVGTDGGVIEVDESFIGGKARNMHTAKRKVAIQGRGATGKTVVMGMLERGGIVHTNGMENYWSLTKRALHGTYVSVEPFHLFRYLDEQAFRYNNRTDKTNADRFSIALSQIAGKRLQFKELTGQVEGSF